MRREKCTAWDERCKKCSRLGHFPKQCQRFKPRNMQTEKKNAEKDETNATVSHVVLEIGGDRCDEVVSQVSKKSSVQVKKSHRRKILKHMRFDTQSGKYVSCTWKSLFSCFFA